MHLDADRALFGGRARRPSGVLVRLAALVAALLVNAATTDLRMIAALAAAGAILGALDGMSADRWKLLAAVAAYAGLALGVAVLLGVPAERGAPIALRAVSGVALAAWFGGAVSWPALRVSLARAGVSERALDLADGAVTHGQLLHRALARQREAAAVRAGDLRLAPAATARVLAGALDRALERGERLEEARAVRAPGAADEPADGGPVLAARGLGAGYRDGLLRLRGVDLELGRGEWIAIAGPSGSGKSTLLRTLAGLLGPAEGALRRLGRDLDASTPQRARLDRRVGLVFQSPDDQLLGSTPLDDVSWGLRQRGVPDEEACERAIHALESLGIERLAHRPVHTLSCGEKKRVALAAALACEPELLLCDEPTAGLDPVAAARLVRAIEAAAAAGPLAVVWATHDLAHLPAAVRRVVHVRDGRAIFDGARREARCPARLVEAGLREGGEEEKSDEADPAWSGALPPRHET